MSKCLTSKSVLRRMSVQLNLPFPSTSDDLQNMSQTILERELKRQRVSEEHASYDDQNDHLTLAGGLGNDYY